MKNKNIKDKFMIWARCLYDENCLERHSHGQQQYKSFDVYFKRHEDWLWNKYQVESKETNSLYLS